jgi:hypothetical protein
VRAPTDLCLRRRVFLEHRLAADLPELRLPVGIVQRLSDALGGELVQLLTGDVRPLGSGAYEGQLCVVTPTRVLLATATRSSVPEASFGLETWEREIAPVPRCAPPPRAG